MNYSLLDKFRGAWLGSAIAQELIERDREPIIGDNRVTEFSDRIKPQFWRSQGGITSPTQKEFSELIEIYRTKIVSSIKEEKPNVQPRSSEIILPVLPMLLYYHDYWWYLANFLTKLGKSFQKSQSEVENILVWCYLLRLALRGELAINDLTRRVVMGTGLQQQSATCLWLKSIELSCLKGFSSMQLLKELSPTIDLEIPLSVFCFLNNSEDFYLTIAQALSLEKQVTSITTLSSILAGAYNGLRGIPINWHNLCRNREFYSQIIIETKETIEQWQGNDCSIGTEMVSSTINAPKMWQRRSNLKIISQQEYEPI